ncbi:50S ribosomal protein L10 [Candidatus Woesearchaeota archaeon]|nr:50S ribosomal protein L10 [Candidatus Woesearchaeota archaeon]
MAHVSDKKKKIVEELARLLDEYPIIGAVNMENLPAKQLQKIRQQIRDKAKLTMTKRRLIKLAFKQSNKKDLDKLVPHLEGMPALLFTKENPFKIFNELEKNKSKAPAKPGQVAPKDIIVAAGPTSFTPGPIIGQLGKFRIKTGVEKGKIVIKEDAVVARKGETISEDLAQILLRMKIEPMEIGLDLVAVYEDGSIFTKDILKIDTAEYESKFVSSASESLNLAVYIVYPCKETIELLLKKAHTDSKSLALSQNILTDDTLTDLIVKANNQANSLSGRLSSGPEEKRFDKPEEEKQVQSNEKEHTQRQEKDPEENIAAGLGSLFG